MESDDIVLIIFASTIAYVLIVSVSAPLISGTPITPEGRILVGEILFAIIAVVSYIAGGKKR